MAVSETSEILSIFLSGELCDGMTNLFLLFKTFERITVLTINLGILIQLTLFIHIDILASDIFKP